MPLFTARPGTIECSLSAARVVRPPDVLCQPDHVLAKIPAAERTLEPKPLSRHSHAEPPVLFKKSRIRPARVCLPPTRLEDQSKTSRLIFGKGKNSHSGRFVGGRRGGGGRWANPLDSIPHVKSPQPCRGSKIQHPVKGDGGFYACRCLEYAGGRGMMTQKKRCRRPSRHRADRHRQGLPDAATPPGCFLQSRFIP